MENNSTYQLLKKQTGGANAITGFDYQCLYSCYTVLNCLNESKDIMYFEGLEDIDLYQLNNNLNIQVKHSKNKKNSTFFKAIIKNFIKIYLSEPFIQNRKFKLIYDFKITEGYIKELIKSSSIDKTLNNSTNKYWNDLILDLKENNPNWNWVLLDSDKFIKKIEFEFISQNDLQILINKRLIELFDINVGNEILYARSLYHYCFMKMKNRETLSMFELNIYIETVKNEINKGIKNPAYHWIKEINFNEIPASSDNSFFEGKNTLPNDIIANYPVPREKIEKDVIKSINNNIITIIKSSSGQGKSTIAWRVAYLLHENFEIYKLNYCNNAKELDNIIEFILSKIKIGQIPLLILDNLSENLKEWNLLSQLLLERIGTNYKILITSRVEAWYSYCGDISQIRKYNFISLKLDQKQALEIFTAFKNKEKIHKNITNWKSAWEQIDNKGLLIEYVYLITHGEMLSERINYQLKILNSQENSVIKFDILKKICFADILDIKLSAKKLFSFYNKKKNVDITDILASFNKEYLIISDSHSKYIKGLHPIRSKHILDNIHKYSSINDTIIDLLDIADREYIPILYSNIPLYINEDEKDEFYSELSYNTKNKSIQYYYDAIRGLLSGSIQKYYLQNKDIFIQINQQFELLLFLAGISPFNSFPEFNYQYTPIEDFKCTFKDNEFLENIINQYEKIPKFKIKNSDVFSYTKQFYTNIFKGITIEEDYNNFSKLLFLLTHINKDKLLINDKIINQIWINKEKIATPELSKIFFCWYILNKKDYLDYIKINKKTIFNYITIKTNSIRLYENKEKNIIVEYILSPLDLLEANFNSIERIDTIFYFLPFYEIYGSDSIKLIPNIFNIHDDSYKRMPIKNVIISKNQELTQIWNNTISKNYEYITIVDWLEFWIDIRKNLIKLNSISIKYFIDRIINPSIVTKELKNYKFYYEKSIKQIGKISIFPKYNNPFDNNSNSFVEDFLNNSYFSYISYFYQKIVAFSKLEEQHTLLAIKNLLDSQMYLEKMQVTFNEVLLTTNYSFSDLKQIELEEKKSIFNLLSTCLYYKDQPTNINLTRKNILYYYLQKKIGTLKKAEEILKGNESFTTNWIFPNDILYDNHLYKLPIVIDDFDINNIDLLSKLIFSLSSLSNLDINFIIILLKINSTNKLKEQGFLINNEKLKILFDKNYNEDDLVNLILPLNIEEKYILNFNDKYIINKNLKDETFDKICIQLLYYSKLNGLKIDIIIRDNIQNNIKNAIDEIIKNRNYLSIEEKLFIENKIDKVINENNNFSFDNYISDINYYNNKFNNICTI